MLDSALDPDQEALRSVARDFLGRAMSGAVSTAGEPREAGTAAGLSPMLWASMARLGWLGLGLPTEVGGGGAGLTTLCALYGELGRALAPAPCLEVSVVVAETILRAGSAEQRAAILPELAAGRLIALPALVDEDGSSLPSHPTVQARAGAAGGWVISGTRPLVPFADSADLLLVPATAADAGTLFLVRTALPGVTITPAPSMTGLPTSSVVLENVQVGADAVLGMPGLAGEYLAPVIVRGKLLRCAEIAGAGDRVLELVLTYAREREQFGGPIGRYQAVQYLCTDLAMATRVTQLLTRQAAWLLDQGEQSSARIAAANAYGSAAARRIAHCAHEVFAGLGFMQEHDLHLFSRRLKYWEMDLGGASFHSGQLAAQL
jgi:alkylation response protein AidB-like acyl-CoA dehydrogenase